MLIDNALGITYGKFPYGVIYTLYALFMLVPGLAVGVRRLHDTGRSGWMILINLIPVIGAIWFLVLMLIEGDAGDNEYGADPKKNPVVEVI